MKLTLSRILIALSLALVGGEALAQESVLINATVKKSCSVVNNTPTISLVDYDPASALAGTGTMSVTCTKGTSYLFTVNDGSHFLASRRLQGTLPDASLDYLSYDFLAMTVGAGSFSPGVYTSVGTGSVQQTGDRSTGVLGGPMTFSFQVSIPAGQEAATDAVGGYSDTVTVTFAY